MLEKYSAQLRDWNLAYENFMNAKSHSFTSKQIRGAALLKILHTTAYVMAACNPPVEDYRDMAEALYGSTACHKFTKEFQTIINLSRSLITTAEQDARNGIPSLTFSTDLGLIGPLYFVAGKCRIQSIRNQAVELLGRYPRKEGMWDSVTASKVVQQLWAVDAQHNAFQQSAPDEISFPIPLHDVVDLVFYEGGRFEWIWKQDMPSPPTSSHRLDSMDRPGVARHKNWMDTLEEQSLSQGTSMSSSYGAPSDSASPSRSSASSNMS